MITPLDIQNKEFSKGVRGYKEDEVDEFLDLLTVDMEKLLTENNALKIQLEKQEEDLKKYKSTEDTVLETLEAAKRLMGDISASAEKRAEMLLKNAELDAELIQREARENVERLTEENIKLKRRFADFKARFKSLLEAELERFETSSQEIYSQYGMEDLKELAGVSTGLTSGDMTHTQVMRPVQQHSHSQVQGAGQVSETMSATKVIADNSDMSKTIVNFKALERE